MFLRIYGSDRWNGKFLTIQKPAANQIDVVPTDISYENTEKWVYRLLQFHPLNTHAISDFFRISLSGTFGVKPKQLKLSCAVHRVEIIRILAGFQASFGGLKIDRLYRPFGFCANMVKQSVIGVMPVITMFLSYCCPRVCPQYVSVQAVDSRVYWGPDHRYTTGGIGGYTWYF